MSSVQMTLIKATTPKLVDVYIIMSAERKINFSSTTPQEAKVPDGSHSLRYSILTWFSVKNFNLK